ncbi:hypothetical protein B566_EDAN001158 [Ephemera danica]|nr:hypothetical protein B566_EDAN001158 [Ephemera danica]
MDTVQRSTSTYSANELTSYQFNIYNSYNSSPVNTGLYAHCSRSSDHSQDDSVYYDLSSQFLTPKRSPSVNYPVTPSSYDECWSTYETRVDSSSTPINSSLLTSRNGNARSLELIQCRGRIVCRGLGSGRRKNERPPSPAVVKKRRLAANARERRRMNGLNEAFDRLREVIPSLDTAIHTTV